MHFEVLVLSRLTSHERFVRHQRRFYVRDSHEGEFFASHIFLEATSTLLLILLKHGYGLDVHARIKHIHEPFFQVVRLLLLGRIKLNHTGLGGNVEALAAVVAHLRALDGDDSANLDTVIIRKFSP